MSPCLKETVQSAFVDSMFQIKKQWENLAKTNLRSGKAAYVQGLSVQINKDGLSGSVRLEGDFPTKLEKGSPPYDLKILFSQSAKVKFSKSGGWYIDIPMRQGTPNSTNFSSSLSNSVYTQAKKLPAWGVLRTNQGSTESWTGYQYSASTFDYLTKVSTSSGKNSYMTWRRVSDKSDPTSWIHPGFTGVHLLDQMEPSASSILESTVKKYINQVFGF
jgi:hypothetical protein